MDEEHLCRVTDSLILGYLYRRQYSNAASNLWQESPALNTIRGHKQPNGQVLVSYNDTLLDKNLEQIIDLFSSTGSFDVAPWMVDFDARLRKISNDFTTLTTCQAARLSEAKKVCGSRKIVRRSVQPPRKQVQSSSWVGETSTTARPKRNQAPTPSVAARTEQFVTPAPIQQITELSTISSNGGLSVSETVEYPHVTTTNHNDVGNMNIATTNANVATDLNQFSHHVLDPNVSFTTNEQQNENLNLEREAVGINETRMEVDFGGIQHAEGSSGRRKARVPHNRKERVMNCIQTVVQEAQLHQQSATDKTMLEGPFLDEFDHMLQTHSLMFDETEFFNNINSMPEDILANTEHFGFDDDDHTNLLIETDSGRNHQEEEVLSVHKDTLENEKCLIDTVAPTAVVNADEDMEEEGPLIVVEPSVTEHFATPAIPVEQHVQNNVRTEVTPARSSRTSSFCSSSGGSSSGSSSSETGSSSSGSSVTSSDASADERDNVVPNTTPIETVSKRMASFQYKPRSKTKPQLAIYERKGLRDARLSSPSNLVRAKQEKASVQVTHDRDKESSPSHEPPRRKPASGKKNPKNKRSNEKTLKESLMSPILLETTCIKSSGQEEDTTPSPDVNAEIVEETVIPNADVASTALTGNVQEEEEGRITLETDKREKVVIQKSIPTESVQSVVVENELTKYKPASCNVDNHVTVVEESHICEQTNPKASSKQQMVGNTSDNDTTDNTKKVKESNRQVVIDTGHQRCSAISLDVSEGVHEDSISPNSDISRKAIEESDLVETDMVDEAADVVDDADAQIAQSPEDDAMWDECYDTHRPEPAVKSKILEDLFNDPPCSENNSPSVTNRKGKREREEERREEESKMMGRQDRVQKEREKDQRRDSPSNRRLKNERNDKRSGGDNRDREKPRRSVAKDSRHSFERLRKEEERPRKSQERDQRRAGESSKREDSAGKRKEGERRRNDEKDREGELRIREGKRRDKSAEGRERRRHRDRDEAKGAHVSRDSRTPSVRNSQEPEPRISDESNKAEKILHKDSEKTGKPVLTEKEKKRKMQDIFQRRLQDRQKKPETETQGNDTNVKSDDSFKDTATPSPAIPEFRKILPNTKIPKRSETSKCAGTKSGDSKTDGNSPRPSETLATPPVVGAPTLEPRSVQHHPAAPPQADRHVSKTPEIAQEPVKQKVRIPLSLGKPKNVTPLSRLPHIAKEPDAVRKDVEPAVRKEMEPAVRKEMEPAVRKEVDTSHEKQLPAHEKKSPSHANEQNGLSDGIYTNDPIHLVALNMSVPRLTVKFADITEKLARKDKGNLALMTGATDYTPTPLSKKRTTTVSSNTPSESGGSAKRPKVDMAKMLVRLDQLHASDDDSS